MLGIDFLEQLHCYSNAYRLVQSANSDRELHNRQIKLNDEFTKLQILIQSHVQDELSIQRRQLEQEFGVK